jgi:uncharacterized protein (DUF1330 family)
MRSRVLSRLAHELPLVGDHGAGDPATIAGGARVAGYVIAIVDVTDPAGYQAYSRQVPATIAKYGGRYLVRGGTTEVREGEWPGPRTVILEFPSLARALEWYDSPEYAPLRPMRQANARSRIAFFEGVAKPTG